MSALRAQHAVTFSYRRSAGGAIERFLGGLARGELWGSRAADGRVVIPPVDHDPETGAASDEFIRIPDTGLVCSWTWVAAPSPAHPLDRPFAFALIELDGAATALLHVVDVADESEMVTGMRVRADWRASRVGSILDIRAFVPGSRGLPATALPEAPTEVEVVSDLRLEYNYEPGVVLSGFLRSLGAGRIEGGRCAACMKVYVPPHPRCPACGTGPMPPVVVGDRGTIVSYTVVHVPFHGMTTELPFAWAWVRLDGADVPFAHLLGEVALDAIHVGQQVEAVWAPASELAPTWESIRHFRPMAP
jgi:uncharacterized OB-fold protein